MKRKKMVRSLKKLRRTIIDSLKRKKKLGDKEWTDNEEHYDEASAPPDESVTAMY